MCKVGALCFTYYFYLVQPLLPSKLKSERDSLLDAVSLVVSLDDEFPAPTDRP